MSTKFEQELLEALEIYVQLKNEAETRGDPVAVQGYVKEINRVQTTLAMELQKKYRTCPK